ncbi:MAG: serine protease [Patescibacteria group bacterium]
MALIPPAYLNSVLSIGVSIKNEKNESTFKSLATGFLVGKPVGEKNEKGQRSYRLFVVTNRHVFYNDKTKQYVKEVLFRFNTTEGKSHHFKVKLLNSENKPIWSMHSDEKVDLAVLPINANAISEAGVDFYFFRENDLFYANNFKTKNISTGDGLFVLGFPMSISGKSKNFVIVRQGIIARVDEEVLEDKFYFIDASAYPGNSGGPVIVKPEIVSIQGINSNNSAGLIGVISSGVTYSDVAVSQQTGEAKVIFTEQTGLVKVVPVELIYEIIDEITKPSVTKEEAEVKEAGSEVKTEETVENNKT